MLLRYPTTLEESSDHHAVLNEAGREAVRAVVLDLRPGVHYVVRDLMLSLSLCHNVTPVYPDEDDPDSVSYTHLRAHET